MEKNHKSAEVRYTAGTRPDSEFAYMDGCGHCGEGHSFNSLLRRCNRILDDMCARKLSTLLVMMHFDAYADLLRVLATAASQTSGSSDTVPPSASGKLSALWNRRATTGILG